MKRTKCSAGHTLAVASLTTMMIASGVQAADQPAAVPSGTRDFEAIEEAPQRSWRLALGLSMGTTLTLGGAGIALSYYRQSEAALALSVTGAIVGPSVGHIYTGEYWHALGTSLGRGAFLALGTVGLSYTVPSIFDEDRTEPGWAMPAFMVGMLGVTALTVYDFIDAPFSAERFNARAQAVQLSLAPQVLPPPVGHPDAGLALGLGLTGRF